MSHFIKPIFSNAAILQIWIFKQPISAESRVFVTWNISATDSSSEFLLTRGVDRLAESITVHSG